MNRSPNTLTIDPTENVKALTEAANLRQDDLRNASDRYNEAQIRHIKEIVTLTTSYEEKLALAEAKRLDAIRSVDVNAIAISSEKQTTAASIMANSVTGLAKSLEEQLKQYVDQINTRLAAVEKSQYEGQGKGSVMDPQMQKVLEKIEGLSLANSQSQGRVAERKDYTALIIAVTGLLIAAIALIVKF